MSSGFPWRQGVWSRSLWQHWLPVLLLVLFCGALRADPHDVLVDNLTFVRPEKWVWEAPPTNSTAVTQFAIPNAKKELRCEIRFYISDKSPLEAEKLWKSYFPKPDEPMVRFGGDVVFLRFQGTYIYKNYAPKANQLWVGAVLNIPNKKYVHVRILGPVAEVEKALVDFRKMVEDAVHGQPKEVPTLPPGPTLSQTNSSQASP